MKKHLSVCIAVTLVVLFFYAGIAVGMVLPSSSDKCRDQSIVCDDGCGGYFLYCCTNGPCPLGIQTCSEHSYDVGPNSYKSCFCEGMFSKKMKWNWVKCTVVLKSSSPMKIDCNGEYTCPMQNEICLDHTDWVQFEDECGYEIPEGYTCYYCKCEPE